MATTTRYMTVDELERDGTPEGRWELINGELAAMTPGGEDHGLFGLAVASSLYTHVVPPRLGRAFGADTGFVLSADPPVVRVPDAAFVRAERLPANRDRNRFLRVVPDIVAEVVSPNDRPGEVLAKVSLWLEAGTELVWLIDPDREIVTVFGRDRDPRSLTVDQTLDGGDVLPGFTLPVRDIFAG